MPRLGRASFGKVEFPRSKIKLDKLTVWVLRCVSTLPPDGLSDTPGMIQLAFLTGTLPHRLSSPYLILTSPGPGLVPVPGSTSPNQTLIPHSWGMPDGLGLPGPFSLPWHIFLLQQPDLWHNYSHIIPLRKLSLPNTL